MVALHTTKRSSLSLRIEKTRTLCCSEANLVELAVSAYDNGLKPYQHIGTLLKEFSIKARIDTWYNLKIIFGKTETIYHLSDDSNQLLETLTINHRSCPEFNLGILQGLYFGGECPAPQAVSVCYD